MRQSSRAVRQAEATGDQTAGGLADLFGYPQIRNDFVFDSGVGALLTHRLAGRTVQSSAKAGAI